MCKDGEGGVRGLGVGAGRAPRLGKAAPGETAVRIVGRAVTERPHQLYEALLRKTEARRPRRIRPEGRGALALLVHGACKPFHHVDPDGVGHDRPETRNIVEFARGALQRSEAHTSELQSLMRISYA